MQVSVRQNWIWEPEPLRALIFEGLSKDQVPIKLTGSGVCDHRDDVEGC